MKDYAKYCLDLHEDKRLEVQSSCWTEVSQADEVEDKDAELDDETVNDVLEKYS